MSLPGESGLTLVSQGALVGGWGMWAGLSRRVAGGQPLAVEGQGAGPGAGMRAPTDVCRVQEGLTGPRTFLRDPPATKLKGYSPWVCLSQPRESSLGILA